MHLAFRCLILCAVSSFHKFNAGGRNNVTFTTSNSPFR